MSFTEAVGQPGTGNIVLQHQGFRGKKYDLDYRGHKRVVRVVDRMDDNGNLGNWTLDQDATGDLCLGMCWPQDKNQRELPMWSFHYLSVLTKSSGPKGGVPTPGAGGSSSGVATLINPSSAPAGGEKKSSQMNALPIGDQLYNGDGRMNALTVPPRVLKAQGPSNPNAAKGNDPNPAPFDDPSAGPQGNLFGGQARSLGNQDTGSTRLILGIGGVGQGFGPQGTGFGGRIGGYTGVGSYFGGSFGAVFSGVANFFGGGGKVGVTFTDPSAPPKKQ